MPCTSAACPLETSPKKHHQGQQRHRPDVPSVSKRQPRNGPAQGQEQQGAQSPGTKRHAPQSRYRPGNVPGIACPDRRGNLAHAAAVDAQPRDARC